MACTHMFTEPAGAGRYAEHRPAYPPALYERLYAFCGPGRELAVDVATGSGQAAVELSKAFDQVIALDSDAEQLRGARPAPNVEYRTGLAEVTGVPSEAADLVTTATALHWFDHPKFRAEAARILKPGGTLAAWGYGVGNLRGNAAATQVLRAFADPHSGPLAAHWTQTRRFVDEEYSSLMPDPALFGEARRDAVLTTNTTTIARFVGYVSTWSACGKFRQANHGAEDPLAAFQQQLMAAYGTNSEEHGVEVEWRIYMLMARKL